LFHALLFASLFLAPLFGCSENVGQLDVNLIRPPDPADEPIDGLATHIRIRISGERSLSATFPVEDKRGTLSDVPIGPAVITVEALGAEGKVVSRGRSAPQVISARRTTVEIFIGQLEQFSAVALTGKTRPKTMQQPRTHHAAVSLPNGDLMLVGGGETGWRPGTPLVAPLRSVEILAGSSLLFQEVDSTTSWMFNKRIGHSATLLPSGNVLVAGGALTPNSIAENVEVYNPKTKSFTRDGLRFARAFHGAVLRDGKVALIGGETRQGELLQPGELYGGGTSALLAGLNTRRINHATLRLADGTLMVCGGYGQEGNVLATIELLRPNASQWEISQTSLLEPRAHHTATLLPDGRVLIVGGLNALDNASDLMEVYVPKLDTILDSANINVGRWNHTTTVLRDGRVLIVGGFASTRTGSPTRSVEEIVVGETIFTINKDKFDLKRARAGHSATLLDSGMLLIAGGTTDDGVSLRATDDAEVFIY
jgi:hypothetical protein